VFTFASNAIDCKSIDLKVLDLFSAEFCFAIFKQ